MMETAQQSVGSMVATGLQFHQRGDLAAAEQVYRTILAREPRNADALHLMGSVRGRQGLTAEGILLMEQAIEASPRVSIYHNNLGNLKLAACDIAGAEESYRRATRLDRKNSDAHLNLGKLLSSQGRAKEAKVCFLASLRLAPRSVQAHMSLGMVEESEDHIREALQSYGNAVRIDPQFVLGHLAIGNAHVKLGALEKAEASFRAAIAIDPHYAEGLYNLAHTLQAQGKSSEAVEFYRKAVEFYREALTLSPKNRAEIQNHLGLALRDLKLHEEAVAAFREAIELMPGFDESYFNLGREMMTLGDAEAGMEMLHKAIEINPGNASAYLQLGVALHSLGRLNDAIDADRKSLELNPSCPVTRRNLGMVLALVGDIQGLEILETAMREDPENIDLHWSWAVSLLLHGRYEDGWREYEWRMQTEEMSWQHQKYDVPRWTGEPLAGKRILLYTEQGFGDTLQFARYARLVAERGGTVVLEVQQGLQRWCAALPGVAECIVKKTPLPQFDTFAPLMSLPYILNTRKETIPPPVAPLLEANRTASPKLQVGIVWGGNPKHKLDLLRSTRLAEWSGLGKIAGVDFTSLQAGGPAAQIEEGGHGLQFVADCKGVRDFADTASIIAGLDLVITVDTSVAHLAGSMGKPVWILLYNVLDWRWGLDGDRTAWYPSARLFRQRTAGDWSGVFSELECSLRDAAAAHLRLSSTAAACPAAPAQPPLPA